jgi:hypothetical protein
MPDKNRQTLNITYPPLVAGTQVDRQRRIHTVSYDLRHSPHGRMTDYRTIWRIILNLGGTRICQSHYLVTSELAADEVCALFACALRPGDLLEVVDISDAPRSQAA